MTPDGVTIPVLLYHSVGGNRERGDRFAVSLPRFEAHMQLLRERARESLTVSGLVGLLSSRKPPPPRPVVITFDDGYADFAELALPVLERHGLASTLYVTTGEVGRAGMLSWDQLGDAMQRGVELGGHTHSHPQLDLLPRSAVAQELETCKRLLEDRLGDEVTTFAYPHGYHDRQVREAVIEAGFRSAAAVKNALSHLHDDPFAFGRLTVSSGTETAQLGEWLDGRGAPIAWRGERLRTRAGRWARRARDVPKRAHRP